MKNLKFNILIIISALIFPLLFLGADLVSTEKIFGPGGDAYWYLWVFKTFRTSIENGIFWPQHITNVFYPIGFDMSAGYESVLIYYTSVIFQQFAGITQTYNLLIYFGYFLNIIGGYFLLNHITKQKLIAITFGVTLAFAPQVIGRTNGHLPLIWIWPILFYLGFLLKFLEKPILKYSIPLGIFAGLSLLVSWYFLAYLLIFTLGLSTHSLLQNSSGKIHKIKTLLIRSIPALTISITVLLFFAWPMFASRIIPNNFYGYPFEMGLGNLVLIKEYNLSVIEPLTISGMSSLSQYSILPHSRGETVSFIGLYAIFLIAILLIGKKVKKTKSSLIWLILCIVFYLFALGIFLRIVPGQGVIGESFIRVPFYWLLFKIPILNTMHAPGRFWMPAHISLIVFLALIPTLFKTRAKVIIVSICFILIAYENSSYTFDRTSLPPHPIDNRDSTAGIFPLKVQDPESLKIAVYFADNVLSGYQTHTTFSSDEDLVMWNSIFQPLVDPNANLWKVLPDLDEPLSPEEVIYMSYHLFNLDGYYFRNETGTIESDKLKTYLQSTITSTKRNDYDYFRIDINKIPTPQKTIIALENGFYTPEEDGNGKYRESRGVGKISIFNPGKLMKLKNNLKISNGKNTQTSLNGTNITIDKNSILEIKSGFNELIISTDDCEPAGEIRCRGFRIEKFDVSNPIFY